MPKQPLFSQVLTLVDQLIPAPCLLCGCLVARDSTSALICTYCRNFLPQLRNQDFLCHCCALPLATAATLCGQCVAHPPAFSTAKIPFSYAYPVDSLIHKFKYRRHLGSGKLLGELFLEHLGETKLPDLLVPVPMHWLRRWQRGFNQSEVLAQQISNALGLRVVDACKRQRQRYTQKELNRSARLKNMRNAFSLRKDRLAVIQGVHIALVDDVITTTATARALSELLLKHGAQRVDIWALARTPDD